MRQISQSYGPQLDVQEGSRGFWHLGWPLLLLAFGLAVPLLVWFGWIAISNSTDGTDVSQEIDRSAPGFQAFVEPTPTLLLVHSDDAALRGLALLVLTDVGVVGSLSDESLLDNSLNSTADSAVLLIPVEMLTDSGVLSKIWAESGTGGLVDAVTELLGARPQEVQVVDNAGWQALVAATAPVVLVSPDALVTASGEVVFSSGEVLLRAADVGSYLAWRNPQESPLAALFRVELFWQAWLAQVGEALRVEGAGLVIPGERDRGMGRFVPAMAAGRATVFALPGVLGAEGTVSPDVPLITELVREVVPFRVPTLLAQGPRVRLLNGTGELSHLVVAARVLSRAGAEVVVVGNAAERGWQTTKIVYHDLDFGNAAEALQRALGVGMVAADDADNSEWDITITFGADFVSNIAAHS